MQARTLESWVKKWWESQAEKEGFSYRGRPSMKRFLTAIAKGEYKIVKSDENNIAE